MSDQITEHKVIEHRSDMATPLGVGLFLLFCAVVIAIVYLG